MDIRMFDLPVLQPENYAEISKKVSELHRRYRDRKRLDAIEVDWLDTANNWLLTH